MSESITISTKDYRSDIVLNLHMTLGGVTVNVPQHDFLLRFFTENNARHYDCGRIKGKLLHCATDDEDSTLLTCYIKNHGLGCGMLQCTYIDMSPNDGMEDGVQRTFSVNNINLELVDDISDDTQAIDGTIVADIVSALTLMESSRLLNIASISYSQSTADDGYNVATVTQNDGTEHQWQIKNGSKGERGPQGLKGDKGDQGDSGYSGAAGELEVVNNLSDGGATAALSAEMGKRINEIARLLSCDEVVTASSTLSGKYVDSTGEIKASSVTGSTVSFYPIDGSALSVVVGKTTNSAARVLSLAESVSQETELVPFVPKMGDGSSYSPLELPSYSSKYKYLVVCYNSSNSNTITLNKSAIPYNELVHLLYLARDYSLDLTESDCIESGYINYSDGSEGSNRYWSRTGYVEIPSGVDWYRYTTNNIGQSANSGFAFYNSSKTFISGVKHKSGTVYSGAIPDGAKYVRICYYSSLSSAECSMSLYSTGPEGFKAWLENAVKSHDTSIAKLGKTIVKTYTNADCLVGGRFIDDRDGIAYANGGFICSDYIEVMGSEVVVTSSWATGGHSGFCFYDSSKTFIRGHLVVTETDRKYAIPDNAKYIRFTSKPNETNNIVMSLSGIDGLMYAIDHIDLDKEDVKERHILMVGNSFTKHACENLQDICTNIGVEKVTLQHIYTAGASLEYYAEHLSSSYSLTTSVDGGTPFGGGTLTNIFKSNWDVIVFQQVSGDSGDYDTYNPYLAQLVNSVLENCPNKNVRIMFNMTWSYSTDDGSMWSGIVNANKRLRSDYGHVISGTIASGTAIKNVRDVISNQYGFSYDTKHLSVGVGRYTAACALYVALVMPYSGKQIYNDTITTIDSSTAQQGETTGAVSLTDSNRRTCQDAAMDGYITPWGTDGGDAYHKPDGGIPKYDLSSTVQSSLSKADSALQSHQDLSSYATGAEYDSASKRIYLKHGSDRLTGAYVDATAFIKDGMVDKVAITGGNLVITFNTDSGKEPISLALTDIFNASNYYTKEEIDGAGYLTQESDPTVPSHVKSITQANIASWSGKQDALTFDSAPTAGSSNPVTSGGVHTEFMNVHEILDGLSMDYAIIGRVNSSDNSVTFYHASSVGSNPIPASDVVEILEANTSWTVGLQLGLEYIRLYVASRSWSMGVTLRGSKMWDRGYPQVVIDGDTAQYSLLPTLSQLDTVPTSGSGKLLSSGSVYTALQGKQDTISDLATIRSGAALGATSYQKPSGGIPKSDLASAVQTSLGKADTALQSFTESDPTVPSHVKSITQANIASWNTKQDVSPITNAASGALVVNEYRDFGSVSALTVTLAGGTMANYDLYKFAFTCASDSTTLTLPSGVKLPVDMEMEMATGRRFECVIDYANCLTFNCWD